ncbi:sugar ABC transporter substrate-binding protein [Paenibacillus humicola]|uniref:sugar ABC transporter substrate-binding protein n=1 Tax=Paenibacillus humicola TaxID=3110540 RepID=UPI00237AE774|nr:sugar ABC transporter substrate-binding protein [Paenibacillus humicola]
MKIKMVYGLLAILILLAMTACGSGSGSSDGTATNASGSTSGADTSGGSSGPSSAASSDTSGSKADLDHAQQQIDQYKKLPEFVPAGEPFDARKAMAGKKILSIPASSSVPFLSNIEKVMGGTAKDIGFEFKEWTNQGQPSEWVQGMNNAVNQKYDLVDLLAGTDPAVLKPQIDAAKAAGVKVVSSHLSGLDQTVPNVTENLGIDYNLAGRLLADWACVKTEGKPNVLMITSDEVVSTGSLAGGIKSEFAAVCPDAKITSVNVPVTEWGTKIQPTVQAAVVKDPGLNYILPIYDSMSQFVVSALATAGASDRVKIATFNGTPFVLDLIAQGKVEMDIGENLDWIGRAVLDAEMRLLAGLPFPKDPHIPLYIWDKSNIAQAGSPAKVSTGYGDAYIDGYNKLWMLSK